MIKNLFCLCQFQKAFFAFSILFLFQLTPALFFSLDTSLESLSEQNYNEIYRRVSTDGAFSTYMNEARLLHKITGENWGALIDPRWFCGAAHVVVQRETNAIDGDPKKFLYLNYGEDDSWIDLRHQIKFRNLKVDLGLLYLKSNAVNGFNSTPAIPVKRYNGSPQGTCYLYADLWHTRGGGYAQRALHKGLYTLCNYPDANYSPEIWKQIPLVQTHPRLRIQSFPGDSSSGVYKKVGNEFQLFGIDGGNAPDGNSIYFIPTSHPETKKWIDDCINSVARGTLPDYYLDVRPDFMKEYFATQGNPFNTKNWQIIQYRQKLAGTCQIPIQSNLILIDPYHLIAFGDTLKANNPINIRMFTFLDDANLMDMINRQIQPNDDTYRIEFPTVKQVYTYKNPNNQYILQLGILDRPLYRKIVKRYPHNIEINLGPFKRYRGAHPFAQNDYIVKTTSGPNVNIQGTPIPYNTYAALSQYEDAFGSYQFASIASSDASKIRLIPARDANKSRYNIPPIGGVVLSRKNGSFSPVDFETVFGFISEGDSGGATLINIGAGESGAAIDKMMLQEALGIKPPISAYGFYQYKGVVVIDSNWVATMPNAEITSAGFNIEKTIPVISNGSHQINLIKLATPIYTQPFNLHTAITDSTLRADPIFDRICDYHNSAYIDKLIMQDSLIL